MYNVLRYKFFISIKKKFIYKILYSFIYKFYIKILYIKVFKIYNILYNSIKLLCKIVFHYRQVCL